MTENPATVRFEEIRDLIKTLPGPDLEAGTACIERDRQLTKPPGSLGELERLAHWVACWQHRHPPEIRHPRTAVFAANHGVAVARPVSAFPVDVTKQMVANFQNGGAAVNQLCHLVDSDLRVYEMNLDNPTADFTQGPAMSEDECAHAMAYGMMAVEQGVSIICLGEMGIGNTTSASALCTELFGGDAEDWVGPGTGVGADGLSIKATTVRDGIAANRSEMTDPLHVLRCLGGLELSAIVGAILAARLARVPVILDGFACTAAASVLWAIDPKALDHCLIAHVSAEPGHQKLLDRIGREAVLSLGMRLGEASGAVLALQVVKAAVACHSGMATFAEAKVSGKSG
jgi:nicotinate-nucleotide--dimethylbenzimidazole phosphoribosyltransferase